MGIIGMNGVAGCFLFVSPVEAVPCYLTYPAMHVPVCVVSWTEMRSKSSVEGRQHQIESRPERPWPMPLASAELTT